ncbi:unnamed protein product [Parnassius apollo]|uniref:(apollo) hypothetical protein n=1 Tax=Parnassius apollo TaxID=110799 RepID=A0A8S3W137_PARAO|nr:unnamed protein product [Parnassius apollo]
MFLEYKAFSRLKNDPKWIHLSQAKQKKASSKLKKARKSRRRLGARQYKNYSNEMLEIAVDLVRKKQISAREAARQFAIPKQTILNNINKSHTKSVGCPTRLSDEEAKFVKVSISAGEFGCPL